MHMNLFLARHAKAREGYPDSTRELSKSGAAALRLLCQRLDAETFSEVSQIWHSPYLRAAKTAEILAEEMNLKVELKTVEGARPDDDPFQMARAIADFTARGGGLMLVSHNPFVEILSGILVGEAPNCRTAFKTSTIAGYRLCEPPSIANPFGLWTLGMLVSPAVLH
ncbi:MAG: phosphohistidine phosphatase SixA [Verrucomicrobia bacterium]|nr:MAG: phosphohistidine phosphatase SixA [Verrucomicrobiota bacterium]